MDTAWGYASLPAAVLRLPPVPSLLGHCPPYRLKDPVATASFFDDGGERGNATWPAVQLLVEQKVRPTKAGSVCVKVAAPVLEWQLGLAAPQRLGALFLC